MPHYANGQEAKVGDLIVHSPKIPDNAAKALGILISITPSADSCNGQLMPVARKWCGAGWIPVIAIYQDCITLKDCLPVPEVDHAAAAA